MTEQSPLERVARALTAKYSRDCADPSADAVLYGYAWDDFNFPRKKREGALKSARLAILALREPS